MIPSDRHNENSLSPVLFAEQTILITWISVDFFHLSFFLFRSYTVKKVMIDRTYIAGKLCLYILQCMSLMYNLWAFEIHIVFTWHKIQLWSLQFISLAGKIHSDTRQSRWLVREAPLPIGKAFLFFLVGALCVPSAYSSCTFPMTTLLLLLTIACAAEGDSLFSLPHEDITLASG